MRLENFVILAQMVQETNSGEDVGCGIFDRRRSRLRRHEMIFLNISETIGVIDFKSYHKVVLDGIYISTGNDVISYFRSAANRTNV